MICSVNNCGRSLPKVSITYGYCSYHYRLLNEGKDIATYKIRRKSPTGSLLKDVINASKSKSNNCILWEHGKDNKGYGILTYNGKCVRAHRLSLMLHSRLNPDKSVFCCHKCDIPLCINPLHLYWGDGTTNSRDRHLFK